MQNLRTMSSWTELEQMRARQKQHKQDDQGADPYYKGAAYKSADLIRLRRGG